MRVLIIEDNRGLADAVRRGLVAEGFVVDVSHDGALGLARARESDPDLVLLDLMLPSINGYEICRTLREEGMSAPILVLTAKDGAYDEADALDLGADDYLSKPFSFVVLIARVRALLRRGHGERAPILTAGDLRLDPAERRCWRGDSEIWLTPREFALAEYLVRRKGMLCTRSGLAQHVWADDVDLDSKVIDVYIGYLRRKLDRPFEREDIETVRGEGYRLRSPV